MDNTHACGQCYQPTVDKDTDRVRYYWHKYSLSLSLSLSPGATQPIVGVYFTALYRALASSRTRLLNHTQGRATVGRTPLNE